MSADRKNLLEVPADLPVPVDDGGARHLVGSAWPDLALPATDGASINLAHTRGRAIVYVYPRTGRPGEALPAGWDAIPGARGCTPQSCGFRDHFASSKASASSTCMASRPRTATTSARQRNDCTCRFPCCPMRGSSSSRRSVCRPVDAMTLLKRLTLVVDDGVVTKVFYPVFPPDRSAADVVAWLRAPA